MISTRSLSEIIETPEVVEAGMDEEEGSFGAFGTGLAYGEAVEWMLVGGVPKAGGSAWSSPRRQNRP